MDKKSNTVSLPPFGLAAHKIQGSLWTNPMAGDYRKMDFLFSAADSWLKQLGVQHHDFNFFITHPTCNGANSDTNIGIPAYEACLDL